MRCSSLASTKSLHIRKTTVNIVQNLYLNLLSLKQWHGPTYDVFRENSAVLFFKKNTIGLFFLFFPNFQLALYWVLALFFSPILMSVLERKISMRKPRAELIERGVLFEDPEQGEFLPIVFLCISSQSWEPSSFGILGLVWSLPCHPLLNATLQFPPAF